MKAKTITAKIRDAVPVCLMVEGDEMMRYKNIELPDAIKELEIRDFGFIINADGKIDFNLHFEQDVLPKVFPAPKPKVTRAEKAAVKAAGKVDGVPATEAPTEADAAPADAEPAPITDTPDDAHTAADAANDAGMDEIPGAATDAAVDATTGATTDMTADATTDAEPPVKVARKPGRPGGRKHHGE